MASATRDLTQGKPIKLILSFGIPLLFGFLFQQFYNVADTAIVGRFLGGDALAAVGSTGSVNFLVIGFVMGICNGFSIPVAQMFGAGDIPQLRKYVKGSIILCFIFGIILTALTVILCSDILTATKTPDDIFCRANSYIGTIFAGIPAFFLYNMSAAVLRSLGDSKTPVFWLVVASIINILLDVTFIFAFRLDVFGAALATVIAQLTAGTGCLIKIIKDFPLLKLTSEDKPSSKNIGTLLLMGLPMGLQYSITAIGSVVLQTAVNQLGTAYVTAITAANRLSMFMCCPFDAMGSTMATFAGQNVGAKKWDRLKKGLLDCSLIGLIYSLGALLVIFLAKGLMAKIFLDASSLDLIPLVEKFLMIQASFYFPLALVNIVRFTIQGMGFSPTATIAGVLEMIGRSLLAHFVGIYGFTAACFASPIAWVFADAFLIPAFFICRKKLIKKYADEPQQDIIS